MIEDGTFKEAAAKVLLMAVRWAKSVPSFLQLPAHDRLKLLEAAWPQIFLITISQWSVDIAKSEHLCICTFK